MTVGDLLDAIKQPIASFFNEKSDELNSTIDKVRSDISAVGTKVDDVRDKFDGLNYKVDSRFDGVDSEVSKLNQSLDEIKSELNNGVGDKISTLDQNVSGLGNGIQEEFGGLKDKIDSGFNGVGDKISALDKNVAAILDIYQNEVQQLKEKAEQVTVLSSQLKTANETTDKKQTEIDELKIELNNAKEKISSVETSLEKLKSELEQVKAELGEAQKESSFAGEELNTWKTAVEIYEPVRAALKNCDTFGKILEDRGLNTESETGLLVFVQELGKTIDFIRDIHQTALDLRRQQGLSAKLMTDEEIAVYDALNKCYRHIWNIDFDVFITPGSRKSVAEPFEKTPFSKDEAIYIKDPRNKTLKYIKGIYVPMILNREGKMYKQAYVEAGNF